MPKMLIIGWVADRDKEVRVAICAHALLDKEHTVLDPYLEQARYLDLVSLVRGIESHSLCDGDSDPVLCLRALAPAPASDCGLRLAEIVRGYVIKGVGPFPLRDNADIVL